MEGEAMGTEKLSITISEEFAAELRKYVPPRKRSKFMEEAAWRRLRVTKQKQAFSRLRRDDKGIN